MGNRLSKGKELLKNYDLFIFDWDGTLSEMQGVLRLNESLKRALRTWDRKAKIKAIEARPQADLARAIRVEETKNELIGKAFEALGTIYRPRLHRGVTELLSLLKKRGKKVAILSNGNSARLSRELEKTHIRKYFDIVVSAKDIGATKPDPRGIRAIASSLGARPSRTIYFGDMIDDVLTADLAKADACAISNGFDSHSKLRSAGPKYLFHSIQQLLSEM